MRCRERQTDRQTDRQRDRQTERQRDRQTDRQTDRQRQSDREREITKSFLFVFATPHILILVHLNQSTSIPPFY